MVYIYNGILFSHKKSEILPFAATWMDIEDSTLRERRQTEKDKYHMISIVCGIITNKKQAHRYQEQIGGCQRQGVGGLAKLVKKVKG